MRKLIAKARSFWKKLSRQWDVEDRLEFDERR